MQIVSAALPNIRNGENEDSSNLMEKILAAPNLNRAYKRVVKNKGSHGIDGMSVDELLPYLERNGSQLLKDVLEGNYKPQAVNKAKEYINDGYTWVVDMDLEKYFDTVQHDKLMSLVARKVQNKRVLKLIRAYLNSGVMIDG